MQKNFNLVNYGIRTTVSSMLKCLRECIKHDSLNIFPKEKKVRWDYVTFELFVLLLFDTDVLVFEYQNPTVREPLYRNLVDDMRDLLKIGNEEYYNALNLRMREYGKLLTNKKLKDDERRGKLIEGFLGNLTFTIFENRLFEWEGKIKPIPVLDMFKVFAVRSLYMEVLLNIHSRFLLINRNLFTASPDFTKLSDEELENIHIKNEQEINKLNL
jgi:hypothetical protein